MIKLLFFLSFSENVYHWSKFKARSCDSFHELLIFFWLTPVTLFEHSSMVWTWSHGLFEHSSKFGLSLKEMLYLYTYSKWWNKNKEINIFTYFWCWCWKIFVFFNAESKNDSATNFHQQILIFLSFMNTFKEK